MNWDAVDHNYEAERVRPEASDVWGHMEMLGAYAAGKRVVEFGVHDASTTWALLAGRPAWMRSYDTVRRPAVDRVEAATAGFSWKFILESSLVTSQRVGQGTSST